jgi:hypothetical protein
VNSATFTAFIRRELAQRVDGGFAITLYWNEHDNTTSVDVHHHATGETISFAVAGDRALDAFHHPFAYLAAAENPASPPDTPQDEHDAPIRWEGMAN